MTKQQTTRPKQSSRAKQALPAIPSTKQRQVTAPPEVRSANLREIGGSPSAGFNNMVANQACASLWLKHMDEGEQAQQLQATISALVGIAPRDEIEGMLAAQLVGLHNAAMECLRRAMLAEQPHPARMENLGQANKLARSYAALVEALNRHRGKGQQKVTVEHVHVHQGGQAIVGNVETGGGS